MANKRRGRRSGGRLLARKFEKNLTLGALVGDVVVAAEIFDDALNQDEYFLSADIYLGKSNGTPTEGPL